MAVTDRRPVPALALIVVLCALTTVVWWRVLHRPDPAAQAAPTPCPTARTVLPAPASVAVVVLNGNGQTGLAHRVSGTLQQRGFQVGQPADTSDYPGVARIDYGPASANAAKLLSFYVPGAALHPVTTSDRIVTVALGAKFTSLAAPDAVQRAISQAHDVVASTTSPTPSASGTAGSGGC